MAGGKISRDDLCWLAGWLEGEGSFTQNPTDREHRYVYPAISAWSTDKEVVERAAALLGGAPVRTSMSKGGNRKPQHYFRVCGAKAVPYLELLRPLMGERRQTQIDSALSRFGRES